MNIKNSYNLIAKKKKRSQKIYQETDFFFIFQKHVDDPKCTSLQPLGKQKFKK